MFNMKKKTTMIGVSFALIALLGIGLVAAFPGFGNVDFTDGEVQEKIEFRKAVRDAIEDEDYGTWKSLMESQLTQENFEMLVERHNGLSANAEVMEQMRQAIEDGDYETAQELKEQLAKSDFGGKGQKSFHFMNMAR
jgi:hypothetical protein